MRKITLAILLTSSFLMANENGYISNKKYTYDEVTEIISDKIIENRKKIDELKASSYKESSEIKKVVDDLQIKVDRLASQINTQMNTVKTQQQNTNNSNNSKAQPEKILKPSVVEEIIIEKELFEKVK